MIYLVVNTIYLPRCQHNISTSLSTQYNLHSCQHNIIYIVVNTIYLHRCKHNMIYLVVNTLLLHFLTRMIKQCHSEYCILLFGIHSCLFSFTVTFCFVICNVFSYFILFMKDFMFLVLACFIQFRSITKTIR